MSERFEAGFAVRGVRGEVELVLVAVQALTRVPVRVGFREGALRRAARYFPLVGIGVGLVGWGVFALAARGLPGGVASLLSLGATALLTGGLHEDGLADAADGLLGGRTRADALRIMRDSRVGSFGVLALGVVLGVKVVAVAALGGGMALVAGHAAGRFWAGVLPGVLPYARAEGMAGGVAGPGAREVAVAAVVAAAPLLLLGGRGAVALVLSAGVAGGVGWWARRRLGGYTGDVLGAVEVLTEVAVLLAVLWRAG